jgi:hypothetical protein
MFDAKVNNGVNGIKRTTLTRVNTPKRRIILGHFVAGIVLLVFQIQRVFTFPQKSKKSQNLRIIKCLVQDSPRLGAGISSFKSWGKHILSNCLQRAIDLCIVGRSFTHACATEK